MSFELLLNIQQCFVKIESVVIIAPLAAVELVVDHALHGSEVAVFPEHGDQVNLLQPRFDLNRQELLVASVVVALASDHPPPGQLEVQVVSPVNRLLRLQVHLNGYAPITMKLSKNTLILKFFRFTFKKPSK